MLVTYLIPSASSPTVTIPTVHSAAALVIDISPRFRFGNLEEIPSTKIYYHFIPQGTLVSRPENLNLDNKKWLPVVPLECAQVIRAIGISPRFRFGNLEEIPSTRTTVTWKLATILYLQFLWLASPQIPQDYPQSCPFLPRSH
jgi:hypothetical protein